MFSKFGIGEIILILVVVLLIFGPSKLPQLGKSIGDTLKEFKKSMKSTDEEPAAASKEPEKKEPEKKS